jgi:hypothetical protein
MAGLEVRAVGVAVAVAGALAIIGTAFDEERWLPVLGVAMALEGFVIVVASGRWCWRRVNARAATL